MSGFLPHPIPDQRIMDFFRYKDDLTYTSNIFQRVLLQYEFITWPLYYRQLFICGNYLSDEIRLKISTFIVLNHLDLNLMTEFLINCNVNSLAPAQIDQFFQFINSLRNTRHPHECISFNITTKRMENFIGDAVEEQVPTEFDHDYMQIYWFLRRKKLDIYNPLDYEFLSR